MMKYQIFCGSYRFDPLNVNKRRLHMSVSQLFDLDGGSMEI